MPVRRKPGGGEQENAKAYYYGVGQTERWPTDYPNTQDGASLRRLAFADPSNAAHTEFFGGGDSIYADIFVAGADVSSDIDTGTPAANTDNVVFALPEGRHNIKVWAGISANDAAVVAILCVKSGTDDIKAGSQVVLSSSSGTVYVAVDDVVTDGDDQFYIAVIGLANDVNTHHHMSIEKVD